MKNIILALTNPSTSLFIDLGSAGNDFNNVAVYIIQILLGLIGVLSLLYIIIGGFRLMFAGANPTLAESGKKTIKNALIGLIIAILSYIIVVVVANSLSNL